MKKYFVITSSGIKKTYLATKNIKDVWTHEDVIMEANKQGLLMEEEMGSVIGVKQITPEDYFKCNKSARVEMQNKALDTMKSTSFYNTDVEQYKEKIKLNEQMQTAVVGQAQKNEKESVVDRVKRMRIEQVRSKNVPVKQYEGEINMLKKAMETGIAKFGTRDFDKLLNSIVDPAVRWNVASYFANSVGKVQCQMNPEDAQNDRYVTNSSDFIGAGQENVGVGKLNASAITEVEDMANINEAAFLIPILARFVPMLVKALPQIAAWVTNTLIPLLPKIIPALQKMLPKAGDIAEKLSTSLQGPNGQAVLGVLQTMGTKGENNPNNITNSLASVLGGGAVPTQAQVGQTATQPQMTKMPPVAQPQPQMQMASAIDSDDDANMNEIAIAPIVGAVAGGLASGVAGGLIKGAMQKKTDDVKNLNPNILGALKNTIGNADPNLINSMLKDPKNPIAQKINQINALKIQDPKEIQKHLSMEMSQPTTGAGTIPTIGQPMNASAIDSNDKTNMDESDLEKTIDEIKDIFVDVYSSNTYENITEDDLWTLVKSYYGNNYMRFAGDEEDLIADITRYLANRDESMGDTKLRKMPKSRFLTVESSISEKKRFIDENKDYNQILGIIRKNPKGAIELLEKSGQLKSFCEYIESLNESDIGLLMGDITKYYYFKTLVAQKIGMIKEMRKDNKPLDEEFLDTINDLLLEKRKYTKKNTAYWQRKKQKKADKERMKKEKMFAPVGGSKKERKEAEEWRKSVYADQKKKKWSGYGAGEILKSLF